MSESYDAMWAESEYSWDEEAIIPYEPLPESEPGMNFNDSYVNKILKDIYQSEISAQVNNGNPLYTYFLNQTHWSTPIHDSYYMTAPASMGGTTSAVNDGVIAGSYGAITRNEW